MHMHLCFHLHGVHQDILSFPTRRSSDLKVNNIIVAIKVTVLLAFIIVGGFIILQNYEAFAPNWDPFIPEPTGEKGEFGDRKSTRLNSSHSQISYAVFCLKKKKMEI